MHIGIIGIGKLGFCIAQALAFKGHNVKAYDINPDAMSNTSRGLREQGPPGFETLDAYLPWSSVEYASLEDVVNTSDLVLVIVQTPHAPDLHGSYPVPEEEIADFDYTYLCQSIDDINAHVQKPTCVVIMSTVTPGTLRKKILPRLSPLVKLCYSPALPAMGTAIRDFLFQEIYICGQHDPDAEALVKSMYRSINANANIVSMSIESAELVKLSYNLFISMKIEYANVLAEICQKVPHANVDDVTDALKLCTQRLLSPRYMSAGLPDAGPCHGRDLIAASAMMRDLDLSSDLFHWLMRSREARCTYFVEIWHQSNTQNLPYVLLGYTFKPESTITQGSSALLVYHIAKSTYDDMKIYCYDPYREDSNNPPIHVPACYFIGCNHQYFMKYIFPKGSIIVDPFRMFLAKAKEFHSRNIHYIPLGVNLEVS